MSIMREWRAAVRRELKDEYVAYVEATGIAGFTEKMRAHAIVRDLTAFSQKKSQGTWGSIIFRPAMISSMIGV